MFYYVTKKYIYNDLQYVFLDVYNVFNPTKTLPCFQLHYKCQTFLNIKCL